MDQGRSSDELLRRLDALDRRTQELATAVAQKDALIAEQQALIAVQQEQIAALQAALDKAHEQLALFKKAMFGPRRERYVPGPDQQLLFEALPLEQSRTKTQCPSCRRPNPGGNRGVSSCSRIFCPFAEKTIRWSPENCPAAVVVRIAS